jgi:hypothetical protein
MPPRRPKANSSNSTELVADFDINSIVQQLGDNIDTRKLDHDSGRKRERDEVNDDDANPDGEQDDDVSNLVLQRKVAENLVNVDVAAHIDMEALNERSECTIPHNRNGVTCVATLHRRRQVVFGDRAGVVSAAILPVHWNLASSSSSVPRDGIVYLQPAHSDAVLSIAISDTFAVVNAVGGERTSADTSIKSYIASSSADGVIRIWKNDGSYEHMGDFTAHRGPITGLAFRLRTNILLSVSTDSCVRVWSAGDMAPLDKFFGHQGPIRCVASLVRERCVTGGDDRTPRFWKTDNAVQTEFASVDRSIDCVGMLDESTIVVGTRSGTIVVYDTMRRGPVASADAVHGSLPTGDGTGLEKMCTPQSSATVDATSMSLFRRNPITSMAMVPFSDLFATGSLDGSVKLWKFEKRQSKESRSLLREVGSLQYDGVITGLDFFGQRETETMLCIAISKEPKDGRWFVNKSAVNRVVCVSLPRTDGPKKVQRASPSDAEDAKPATRKTLKRSTPADLISLVKETKGATAAKESKNRGGRKR